MTGPGSFCECPDDLERCHQGLLRAYLEGRLDKHCVMDGLRADRRNCIDAVAMGIYPKALPRAAIEIHRQTGSVDSNELKKACEAVLLLGCRLRIKGAFEAFYLAYHGLVRYGIGRFDIADDAVADDVWQNVFTNLLGRLTRDAPIQPGCLASYVVQATFRECRRALGTIRPTLAPDKIPEKKIWPRPSASRFNAETIETWEEQDHRLAASDHKDVIDRIIFAHMYLEVQATGLKYPVKQMQADWRELSRRPEEQVGALHERVAGECSRFPVSGPVIVIADLVNNGSLESWQIPVVFAAAEGLDLQQTRDLASRLAVMESGTIYSRICRLRQFLAEEETP